MKVYCCLNEKDIENIKNGSLSDIGKKANLVLDPTSDHQRLKGEKYVRFTRNTNNIEHLLTNGDGQNVACFNIPVKMLLNSAGRTYYEYGRPEDFDTVSVVEYLIKSKDLKKEYFKSVEYAKISDAEEIYLDSELEK